MLGYGILFFIEPTLKPIRVRQIAWIKDPFWSVIWKISYKMYDII